MIMKGVWVDVWMKEMAATKNDGHAHVGVVYGSVARAKGEWSHRQVGSGIHVVFWSLLVGRCITRSSIIMLV